MPGGIATEPAAPHGPRRTSSGARGADGVPLKTREQGAATSVLLATSPLLEGIGGRYFEDCNEAEVIAERTPSTTGGVAPYALDPDNADRLWDASLRILG